MVGKCVCHPHRTCGTYLGDMWTGHQKETETGKWANVTTTYLLFVRSFATGMPGFKRITRARVGSRDHVHYAGIALEIIIGLSL